MTLSVYVAASSDEIDRAVRWIAMLRGDGIHVTSSWPAVITAAGGVANPRDAAQPDRYRWAAHDLTEVRAADVYWMLAPAIGAGRGAYAELGFAVASGLVPVASGDTKQSIFTALAHEFVDDDQACAFIQQLARRHT